MTGIFRSQLGDESVPYALIRQLNPGIRNLNRIYPGQKIFLPVRETVGVSVPSDAIRGESKSPLRTYAIREGDSLSRIILTELDVSPEEVLPAYRLIRQLNPDIADPNHLPAGQLLKLPPHLARPVRPAAESLQTSTRPEEKDLTESAMKTPATAEGLLGIIRLVVGRMKGTLTAAGNYFIPLKENAQVTIDCSLIPVVELDDGSTVLLDFGNRLSETLKDLIRQSWTNYAFLSKEELPDSLTSLQAIIRRSKNYTMVQTDKPLAAILKPEILVFPDWIIARKTAAGGTPYRQGLFLLGGNERPFPPEARAFLEKTGLDVTEIADGRAVASTAPLTVPVNLDLRELKGIGLAEQLLKALGETPVRSALVLIFDRVRDGFNLSVTADLLLRKGGKQFIIHTKRLPEQFVRILKEEGTEVILIAENDSGRPLIERTLQGLKIPVSFGHFSIRIPQDGNRPRLAASFPALRAMAGGEALYLVDFDTPLDVLSLLQSRLGARIAKY